MNDECRRTRGEGGKQLQSVADVVVRERPPGGMKMERRRRQPTARRTAMGISRKRDSSQHRGGRGTEPLRLAGRANAAASATTATCEQNPCPLQPCILGHVRFAGFQEIHSGEERVAAAGMSGIAGALVLRSMALAE